MPGRLLLRHVPLELLSELLIQQVVPLHLVLNQVRRLLEILLVTQLFALQGLNLSC